jgi:hypothetical protein
MDSLYAIRFLRHDLFRLSVAWHRKTHSYIATGQQSGTHWLSNLLAWVICSEYGVPPLKHIAEKVIIGHPRQSATYPHIPRLVRTHHAPSPLVHAAPVRRLLTFPKYVVLVRDLRAALVSGYEKRRHGFHLSFSDYLRDHRLFGREHKWDLFKRIVFFNAWGRVCAIFPDQTHVVHYERLRANTTGELERVWRFLELPVSDPTVFERAVAASTKERMSKREEPGRQRDLVRMDDREPVTWFNAADRRYFSEQCRRLLKHDFGYDFDDWSTATSLPARIIQPMSRAA